MWRRINIIENCFAIKLSFFVEGSATAKRLLLQMHQVQNMNGRSNRGNNQRAKNRKIGVSLSQKNVLQRIGQFGIKHGCLLAESVSCCFEAFYPYLGIETVYLYLEH